MLAKKLEQKAKGEGIPTTAKVSAGGAGPEGALVEGLLFSHRPGLAKAWSQPGSGPESLLWYGGSLSPSRMCCLVKQSHGWGSFSSDSLPWPKPVVSG